MTTISSVSSAWSSASVQRASRPGPSPERLLSKIDTDGSGGVSDTELQGLLDNVAKKTGVSSQTSAADLVTRYDANGDGSLNADELGKTLQSVLPPPPPLWRLPSRAVAKAAVRPPAPPARRATTCLAKWTATAMAP